MILGNAEVFVGWTTGISSEMYLLYSTSTVAPGSASHNGETIQRKHVESSSRNVIGDDS